MKFGFKRLFYIKMAQSRGFEPPKVLPFLVFETSAFNHSAKTAYIKILTFFILHFKHFNYKKRICAKGNMHLWQLMFSITNLCNNIITSKIFNISMFAIICSNFSCITAYLYLLYSTRFREICFY